MRPFVSIIIPIYNVEKYLDNCISSILKQSNKNFELILVNDGSKDKSGEVCERYAKKDNRITVKHINNSGVSFARNLGLKLSKGKWILFLDGDDILEPNTIDIIHQQSQKYKDMDMLVGSFKYNYSGTITYADNECAYQKGIDTAFSYGLWNTKICVGSFIVKRKIIEKNNIKFNILTKYGEDVEFITYCLINCFKVKITSEYFFNYMINNQSAISKVTFDRYDCYEAKYRLLKYIQKEFPENKELHILYKEFLLPQAIIDTTFLLCSNGVHIFKLIKYLKQKKYYEVLYSVKEYKNTPKNIRERINKFLKTPLLTWGECFLLEKYYMVRGKIGLVRRRIIYWK